MDQAFLGNGEFEACHLVVAHVRLVCALVAPNER